ncbi:MAG: protein-L-isoaspartate(D-aspartate) O-methyltransferase [Thermodesulfobacteriota bacterium]|nr:protein-L-isoaspartate(D-aspartate) O-methyltransferase [Thermodesulfobacteriota bacterium]
MKKVFLFFIIIILISIPLFAETAEEPPQLKRSRENMVSTQIKSRGISDRNVLAAMSEVPRHLFVPKRLISNAYLDCPLPIGQGQTISQPYIVALMTESLSLTGKEKVLEVGTGSGYQAAILAEIVKDVYTMEIKKKLCKKADNILKLLNFSNVYTHCGDGYFGWETMAPFDCIMITAAVDHIPPPLLKQLKNRGKLILPLGNPFSYQNLVLITKHGNDFKVKQITGVLFVPMTGYALDRN